MKAYARFLVVQDNVLQELLGSDGVFILDKRKNLRGLVADIQMQIYRRRYVRPRICGYRIYFSKDFDNKNIQKEWIRSGTVYREKC